MLNEFIAYLEEQVKNRSIYIWGGQGQSWPTVNEEWITKRIKTLQERKSLTDVWKEGGIREGLEFAILTNEIYKTWSGMTAYEYKKIKD